MKRLFLFLILAGMLIGGASAAEVVTIENTTVFNYEVGSGYTIYQVSANNINEGITTLNFDAYGEEYILTVNCTKSWGWWNFNVNLTYPNGTFYDEDTSTLQPFALDYDLKAQYIDSELDSLFDVDIYVDFTPASGFTIPAGTREIIYFSSVIGYFPDPADVNLYLGTEEDLENIENLDVWSQFTRSMSSIGTNLFSWTWDMILAFVSAIPYVGEYFVVILEITGSIIIELLWYFNFFVIEEPEITFCLAECFILGHAVISGRSFIRILQLVYTDHVKLINGLVVVVEVMFNLIMRVVDIVTSIINAMKPV